MTLVQNLLLNLVPNLTFKLATKIGPEPDLAANMLHVEVGCWPFFSQPSSQDTAFVRRADAMQYAQHIYRIYKHPLLALLPCCEATLAEFTCLAQGPLFG